MIVHSWRSALSATPGLIITEGTSPSPNGLGYARIPGLFILSGGFNHGSAEQALRENRGDLVAFGRPFLANPDLVARMRQDAPLNAPDMPDRRHSLGTGGSAQRSEVVERPARHGRQ